MWFWNVLFNPGQRFQPNTGQNPKWNRGAYLVEALGHCGEHLDRGGQLLVSYQRKCADQTIVAAAKASSEAAQKAIAAAGA
jgi:hypothetical protein